MNGIVHTITSALEGATTQLVVKSGSILTVGNELNTELQVFLRNGAVTVFLAAFVIICFRKGWALAGFLGGLFIAGVGFFAVNGGFELVGNMLIQQFGG